MALAEARVSLIQGYLGDAVNRALNTVCTCLGPFLGKPDLSRSLAFVTPRKKVRIPSNTPDVARLLYRFVLTPEEAKSALTLSSIFNDPGGGRWGQCRPSSKPSASSAANSFVSPSLSFLLRKN